MDTGSIYIYIDFEYHSHISTTFILNWIYQKSLYMLGRMTSTDGPIYKVIFRVSSSSDNACNAILAEIMSKHFSVFLCTLSHNLVLNFALELLKWTFMKKLANYNLFFMEQSLKCELHLNETKAASKIFKTVIFWLLRQNTLKHMNLNVS